VLGARAVEAGSREHLAASLAGQVGPAERDYDQSFDFGERVVRQVQLTHRWYTSTEESTFIGRRTAADVLWPSIAEVEYPRRCWMNRTDLSVLWTAKLRGAVALACKLCRGAAVGPLLLPTTPGGDADHESS